MMDTWGYRQHDQRMDRGTTWRDDRGEVLLRLSFTTGLATGVVYTRGETTYQLGERRFHRDFCRVPARGGREDGPNV